LAGERLEAVWFGLPRLVRFSEELVGSCVERVESRGKALLIRFDLGLSLYSHNQLYGVCEDAQPAGSPDTAHRSQGLRDRGNHQPAQTRREA
jgi:endonuclease-8